jgi:HlyD family secretion protein
MKSILMVGTGMLILLLLPMAQAEEKIGALGRIEPPGGLVLLAGPQGDVVAEVKVAEGELVKKGAPLVVFESKTGREVELAQAETALREADELGAKSIALQELRVRETVELGKNSIALQEQKILASEAEHDFALKRQNRYEGIDGESLSAQQMDERRSQVKVAQAKLATAKLEMERLRLGNEIGAALARQELARLIMNREIGIAQAKHRLDLARERLKQSVLMAPQDGTVVEIHVRTGETAGGKPVVSLANLEPMYVTAEIFEGDLLKIAPGMKASITSTALPAALTGEVETVGKVITGSSRTAKVRIRLLDSRAASKLINMEVDVSIKQEKSGKAEGGKRN